MFTLITGVPGASKTLNALDIVEKERVNPDGSKRPVYYWRIPELKLDWIPLHAPDSTPEEARARFDKPVDAPDSEKARPEDAHYWYNCPVGSIIVIDECQKVFPILPQSKRDKLPKHITELEEHRHKGFDLYFMSQKPRLIDISVRAHVQRHWHFERPFGMEYANRMAWENKVASVDDRADRASADVTRVPFPKKWYGKYRSAAEHNVKKRLPWKKISVAVGGLVAVVALFVFAFTRLVGGKDVETVAGGPGAESAANPVSSTSAVSAWSPESFIPRAASWAWSAPFYDEVAKVSSPPRVIGCMSIIDNGAETCRCHNGQGEAPVTLEFCRAYMRGQVFDPLREYVDIKAENVKYLEASQSRGGGGGGETSSAAYVSPRKSEAS